LTTLGVLDELSHSYNHYSGLGVGVAEAAAIGNRLYSFGNGSKIRATKRRAEIFSEWAWAFGRALFVLNQGIELYSPREFRFHSGYAKERVCKIIRENGIKVSGVDRGVVVAAISAGNGNGVLSADVGLISAFEKTVKYFGLSDCFVCNPVVRNTYLVSVGKWAR